MHPLLPQNPTTLGFLASNIPTWAAAFIIVSLAIIYVWYRLLNFLHTLDWLGEEEYLRDADTYGFPKDFSSASAKTESFVACNSPSGQRNDKQNTTTGGGVTSRRPLQNTHAEI